MATISYFLMGCFLHVIPDMLLLIVRSQEKFPYVRMAEVNFSMLTDDHPTQKGPKIGNDMLIDHFIQVHFFVG